MNSSIESDPAYFPHGPGVKLCDQAVWRGAKNELTYFAEWYKKDSSQIRKMFTFPDEKQTKTPFEMSKHPSFQLPNDNRLKLFLWDYPEEKFHK